MEHDGIQDVASRQDEEIAKAMAYHYCKKIRHQGIVSFQPQ
jgi:hypothetical protein